MTELVAEVALTRRVKASAASVFALLAEVPDSAAHFPGVARLEPRGELEFVWHMEPVGLGRLTVQTVYGVRYTLDEAAGTIVWVPMDGVGNARVEGGWTLTEQGDSTELRLRNSLTLDVPVPRLLKRPTQALVSVENAKRIGTYLDNLQRTFEGGDGRVR